MAIFPLRFGDEVMQRLVPCLDAMWINARRQRLHAFASKRQHQATAIAPQSFASVRVSKGGTQVLKVRIETHFHHSVRGQCQVLEK